MSVGGFGVDSEIFLSLSIFEVGFDLEVAIDFSRSSEKYTEKIRGILSMVWVLKFQLLNSSLPDGLEYTF